MKLYSRVSLVIFILAVLIGACLLVGPNISRNESRQINFYVVRDAERRGHRLIIEDTDRGIRDDVTNKPCFSGLMAGIPIEYTDNYLTLIQDNVDQFVFNTITGLKCRV